MPSQTGTPRMALYSLAGNARSPLHGEPAQNICSIRTPKRCEAVPGYARQCECTTVLLLRVYSVNWPRWSLALPICSVKQARHVSGGGVGGLTADPSVSNRVRVHELNTSVSFP